MADLETLTGTGRVFLGSTFIADVQYTHQTTKHYSEERMLSGPPARVQTFSTVSVHISPATAVAGYLGNRLTLHMSDGHRQDFFAEFGGDCVGTGGPYRV